MYAVIWARKTHFLLMTTTFKRILIRPEKSCVPSNDFQFRLVCSTWKATTATVTKITVVKLLAPTMSTTTIIIIIGRSLKSLSHTGTHTHTHDRAHVHTHNVQHIYKIDAVSGIFVCCIQYMNNMNRSRTHTTAPLVQPYHRYDSRTAYSVQCTQWTKPYHPIINIAIFSFYVFGRSVYLSVSVGFFFVRLSVLFLFSSIMHADLQRLEYFRNSVYSVAPQAP